MTDCRPGFAALRRMLDGQIVALEAEMPPEGYSEAHVKALLLLAKTLQAMEAQKQEKTGDDPADEERDILEFRAELARRLAALADAAPDPAIS